MTPNSMTPNSMTPNFRYPPKPRPGDRIAVLSPSSGLPAVFPAVFELGLRRLRDLGLEPVEYPTTRQLDASPEDRARDVHAAFRDPDIGAVIASIGGDDQIRVLRYLDPDLLRDYPKPFVGFSDNTNLHIYLWNLGIVSYHGAAVMVELGRGGRLNPITEASLRSALFTHDEFELTAAETYNDIDRSWDDVANLESEPEMLPSSGWTWHGPATVESGPAWGGCLEIIDFQLRADRYLLDPPSYAGAVLFVETTEELPPATYVYRVLMGLGERGMLEQFAAVLVGRPKAWSFDAPNEPEQKHRFVEEQAAAVLRALDEYNPAVPVVLGLDIGHTDPQQVIPSGGSVTVDAVRRRVIVQY
jgi:muramoyltetrapeptide carboxypeptidase LdcA involved in peptidoglycan recycling